MTNIPQAISQKIDIEAFFGTAEFLSMIAIIVIPLAVTDFKTRLNVKLSPVFSPFFLWLYCILFVTIGLFDYIEKTFQIPSEFSLAIQQVRLLAFLSVSLVAVFAFKSAFFPRIKPNKRIFKEVLSELQVSSGANSESRILILSEILIPILDDVIAKSEYGDAVCLKIIDFICRPPFSHIMATGNLDFASNFALLIEKHRPKNKSYIFFFEDFTYQIAKNNRPSIDNYTSWVIDKRADNSPLHSIYGNVSFLNIGNRLFWGFRDCKQDEETFDKISALHAASFSAYVEKSKNPLCAQVKSGISVQLLHLSTLRGEYFEKKVRIASMFINDISKSDVDPSLYVADPDSVLYEIANFVVATLRFIPDDFIEHADYYSLNMMTLFRRNSENCVFNKAYIRALLHWIRIIQRLDDHSNLNGNLLIIMRLHKKFSDRNVSILPLIIRLMRIKAQ